MLQVCDVSEGPAQGSSRAVAERRARLQLFGWVSIREWPLSCMLILVFFLKE